MAATVVPSPDVTATESSNISSGSTAKFASPAALDMQPLPSSTAAPVSVVCRPPGVVRASYRQRALCMFCGFNGGRHCRHCAVPLGDGIARLQIDDGSERPLLRGVATATWITDNILAMSRPSSLSISKYGLVDQFIEHGITAIFNTEEPGEHPYCGEPLTAEGAFTYMPSTFEIAGINVVQGGWIDHGTPKCSSLLKLVERACTILDQGGKIAVHCHAGFGRTGVLIACILIYHENRLADDVIRAIRERRSRCIQNVRQARFVRKFASTVAKEPRQERKNGSPTSIAHEGCPTGETPDVESVKRTDDMQPGL